MASVRCSVVLPVEVYIEFDYSKIMDDDYLEQKRNEAIDSAKLVLQKLLGCVATDDEVFNKLTNDELVLHDSDVPALVE